MKLTPLQKKIYDLAIDGPLLIEGPSFIRSLNTCHKLWEKMVLPNRILRHWNINKHGYPPAHCDADGDFKPIKES